MAKVLDSDEWPSDVLQRALYGEAEVAKLCKEVRLSSEAAVDVLADYSVYKNTMKIGRHISDFMTKIAIYPISSADCERGFSVMNLQHSDVRNRLQTETVSSILTVAINGPHFSCGLVINTCSRG